MPPHLTCRLVQFGLVLFCCLPQHPPTCVADRPAVTARLQRWLGPQAWHRDTNAPILSLGDEGAFDDTHIFAPCVALEDGRFSLWYSGSRGTVDLRVFCLGLATGMDGTHFERRQDLPVMCAENGKSSILTATLLRSPTGEVLREKGRLRMWFSSTSFPDGGRLHTLHEATSCDGIHWSSASPAQLNDVYAPTIVREAHLYRMWYTDVSAEPWVMRAASSQDGSNWEVVDRPVLQIDQHWESERLFYPAVIKADGVYLLWYGSYWSHEDNKTAIGFAVSADGIDWHKSPHNPVLRPDPERPWESHYTTSQSVLRLPDGSWRIWYASRKQPPFRNKYFAINTAHWTGPR